MGVPILTVATVALGVYALKIDQIHVQGASTLSPRTIIDASGLAIGQRIMWVRLSLAARRVELIPAVEEAFAVRSLPSTVVIRIRERTEIANLDGHPEIAVDATGHAFLAPRDAHVPSLGGWKGRVRTGGVIDAASRTVLDAFSRFPESIRRRTSHITVGQLLVLTLDGGTQIRFGRMTDLVRKAEAAQAVLAAEAGKKLAYVDVQAPTVPVSSEQAPATPAPTLPGGSAGPAPARSPQTTPRPVR